MMAMSPEQRAAMVVAVSKQLDVMGESLAAARAALAVLSMEAEAELGDEEVAEHVKVGTDDPATCEHPDDDLLEVLGQKLCGSCGLNLTHP